MAKKEFLITGITGFVGQHLAQLLIKDGHKVYGLVRVADGRERKMSDLIGESDYQRLNFLFGDLTHPKDIEKIFRENKFDGVFHFGAQSHAPSSLDNPLETFQTNALSTALITDAILRFQPKCRLVYASSAEVYGVTKREDSPIPENFTLAPVNPYGVSKVISEILLRERFQSVGLNMVIGRGFASNGPGRPRRFAIASDAAQIAEIKKGKKKPVIEVGNLKSERPLTDIRDTVKAYYLLMQKGQTGEVYNIASTTVRPIGDYLNTMLELSNLTGKVRLRSSKALFRPNDIPVQIPDTQKITELGWKPTIPLEVTLQDLLNYWYERV